MCWQEGQVARLAAQHEASLADWAGPPAKAGGAGGRGGRWAGTVERAGRPARGAAEGSGPASRVS